MTAREHGKTKAFDVSIFFSLKFPLGSLVYSSFIRTHFKVRSGSIFTHKVVDEDMPCRNPPDSWHAELGVLALGVPGPGSRHSSSQTSFLPVVRIGRSNFGYPGLSNSYSKVLKDSFLAAGSIYCRPFLTKKDLIFILGFYAYKGVQDIFKN